MRVETVPFTANATFCATVVDQWVVEGLSQCFIAPGSRSTPLALAFLNDHRVGVELFHDERSAAFAAIGHGIATGLPAAILCSSGTAGAHFFAAVIEADLAAVPLLVCTADRPPELWDRGAPQTIDQTAMYGNKVRAFFEPGVPEDTDPQSWRAFAQQAWTAAVGVTPGPVHCNLSFRDPLTGRPNELTPPLPAGPQDSAARPSASASEVAELVSRLDGKTGVIIAGRCESDPGDIIALAETLGWPLLCDHRSGCRSATATPVINHYDALLRSVDFAAKQRPQVVLRIGEIVSSKALSLWLSSLAADIIATRPHGRHIDPESVATTLVDEAGFVAALAAVAPASDSDRSDGDWLNHWTSADAIAARTIRELATSAQPNEIAVARATIDAVPPGGALVLSSSMPVRDVEWFGSARNDISVYSNRGANGIDGVVATAIGVALTGVPTICLIGDVAFLHDSSSLTALRDRSIDLTIVITNNDGGAIFSFLPQHELLPEASYEFLFGTPHGTDLSALCAAHGIAVTDWSSDPQTDLAVNGVRVVIAQSDRTSNLALHDAIAAAVAEALA